MAEKVAEWPEKYGCDGIDLDIEDGAGDAAGAGQNMIYFIKKLRQLQPKMIIGQPTYGFPAVSMEELLNSTQMLVSIILQVSARKKLIIKYFYNCRSMLKLMS